MSSIDSIKYPYDRNDPDAWLALRLDTGFAIDKDAKDAWITDSSRWSRQFLLPIINPFFKLLMGIIQLYKFFVPNFLTSSWLLHRLIVRGLKTFVTPEGNYLLLRHFHLGTQVLEFLKDNIEGVEIQTDPLYPKNLDDFKDDLILKHDINLYNFIIDLNTELERKDLKLSAKENIDYTNVFNPDLKVSQFPNTFLNFIDIQTAIEVILPLFQLLLTDRQFWRSTQSLQLDETMGIYFATLFNMHNRMFMVNNKHPLIPVSTAEAGHRLALHSLSTEGLHALLLKMKKEGSL